MTSNRIIVIAAMLMVLALTGGAFALIDTPQTTPNAVCVKGCDPAQCPNGGQGCTADCNHDQRANCGNGCDPSQCPSAGACHKTAPAGSAKASHGCCGR